MTLQEAARDAKIAFGNLIRTIGEEITPAYWVCAHCGHREYKEQEIMCWKCGLGEMVYKG